MVLVRIVDVVVEEVMAMIRLAVLGRTTIVTVIVVVVVVVILLVLVLTAILLTLVHPRILIGWRAVMIAIAGRRFVLGERGSIPGVALAVLAHLLVVGSLLLVVEMLDSSSMEVIVNPDGSSLAGRVKLLVVMS
jgi:hypothetical protein